MAEKSTFLRYALLWVQRALSTSVGSGNNWGWLFGPAIVGAITSWFGLSKMIQIDHLGPIATGALYLGATAGFVFMVRLFVWAPYELWREQKARADSLQKEDVSLSSLVKDEMKKLQAKEFAKLLVPSLREKNEDGAEDD
jgi:hypothetical protein